LSQLQQQHSDLQQLQPDNQQQVEQNPEKLEQRQQRDELQQQHQHQQQQQHCQDMEDQTKTVTVVMSKHSQLQKRVLCKILGEDEANNVLHCRKIASEENVEVMDLTLNQNERLILYLFFSQDAWCSVGSNINHRSEATGIILPVYNVTDDPYWLFYFPGNLNVVLNAQSTTTITGYWLDTCDDEKHLYQLMSNRSTIVGRNIIRTDHGPLYYICDSELSFDATWRIPPIFNDTIIKLSLLS
jgi:membrane-bound lytic murein transglycosylase